MRGGELGHSGDVCARPWCVPKLGLFLVSVNLELETHVSSCMVLICSELKVCALRVRVPVCRQTAVWPYWSIVWSW